MKNLILIWSLFYMSLVQAAPPTSIKGEAGSASFTQNIVLPNNQVTKQAGINSRIETGSKNLLVNPSFEHATIATGWTFSGGGTPASSTTNLNDGVKSVTTTSTGAWEVYQDSTLYATAKSGQDAEASIWVYSATASAVIWVCPRVNGTTPTASVANGCVQYTNLGLPQKLTVFSLFGSTSTGISINGTGAITYILDDAYLGDRRPSVLGITTTPWQDCGLTTADFTGFGTVTNISIKCQRIGSNLTMRGYFNSGTSTSVEARINLKNNGVALTSMGSPVIAGLQQVGNFSVTSNGSFDHPVLIETSVGYMTFGQGNTGTAGFGKAVGSNLVTSGQGFTINATLPIAEWAGDNNAFTTKCDDPRKCSIIFAAGINSSGTTSAQSTGTGSFAWISSSSWSPTGQLNVNFTSGVFTTAPMCWAIPSSTGQRMVINANSSSAVSFLNRSNDGTANVNTDANVFCMKMSADFYDSFMSQQIIQMRGVPVVPGGERVDTFSVSFGATATTVCTTGTCAYLDQIGTAVTSIVHTGTGLYTLNTARTYSKLKCTGQVSNATDNEIFSKGDCSNTNACAFRTGSTTGAIDTYGNLNCQGSY